MLVSPAVAQPFPQFIFTRINAANDLPSLATSFILKDTRGFMWISTLGGLCRYDGRQVVDYKNKSDDPNSVATNNVGGLVEDKEGNIWIYHYKGVSCFITNSSRFINYTNDSTTTSGLPNGINSITIDTSGKIFSSVSGGMGLQVFNKTLNKFTWLAIDTANDGLNNKTRSNKLTGTLFGPMWDGSMYLISANGVFKFNAKTYTRTRVCGSSMNDPNSIFKDKSGRLWLSEWNGGLFLIDQTSKTRKSVIPNKDMAAITDYTDANGKYWLLAGDYSTASIAVIDPQTLQYQFQVLQIEDEVTSNMTPGKIYCDSEGRVFVTTVNGVLQANPVRQAIANDFIYNRSSNPADIASDYLIRSGSPVDGGGYILGVTGHNGLRFYDSAFHFTKAIINYNYAGKRYDLDARDILKIVPNKYLITGQTGIAMMENEAIVPLRYVPKEFADADTLFFRVRQMLPISNNEYWAKVAGVGIGKFDIIKKTFTRIYKYADKTNDWPLANLRDMHYDNEGRLWINDTYHLFKYDEQKDAFIVQPVNIHLRSLKAIYSFYFNRNNIWMAGENGLLKHDVINGKETFFSTSNGLANNITFKVQADKNNNIWVMHQTGVSMLNAATQQFKNYGQKDGLPISFLETNGVFFIDNYNNLIVGNSGVATKININRLNQISTYQPTVAITRVDGFNKIIPIETSKGKLKEVTLRAEDFPVNILFSIIDFSTNAERKYFYRYAGKDTAWLPCNEGAIPITTTAPGTYTIQVTGQVNGVWAQNTEQIRFTIIPKWHQTKAFTVAALLLSVFTLFLFFKWRIDTTRRNERQQTEIEKLSAEQYKNQLELSQVTNYFSSSLSNKNAIDDVLWDVAGNLIGQLGFEDCMIYLWNNDKTKMIQKAGYGPKGSIEEIGKLPFDVVYNQGVVGYVMTTKQPVIIADTTTDTRYRQDEMARLSELCVPIMHNQELIGIIDSEHHQKNFYTKRHLQLLQTIATLIANKIKAIESEQNAQQAAIEIIEMRQQLKSAQLDALRSQMDPHFIFNSLNSIENFILKNERLLASEYLGKFSKLIRNILDNSKNETIPIEQEIDTLKIYIELERLRMSHCFEVRYEIEDEVLESGIRIPPMLMQPYIENAILHGIRLRNDGDGKLLIKIYLCQPDSLCYQVHDNGVGRAKAAMINAKKKLHHQSYGIAITQSRIEIYNQLNKVQVTVSTTDLYHPQTGQSNGTQVEMILPV